MPTVSIRGGETLAVEVEGRVGAANDDYLHAAQALLPPGAAWTLRRGSTLANTLAGLVREFARVEASAARLIEDSDPTTTQELLPRWENLAGLPGCGDLPSTVEGRQDALQAKLTQSVSPNPATFRAMAVVLGYTGVVVTRNEARPFVAGSSAGDSLRGGPWHAAWSITTDQSTDNDDLLRCLVGQVAPQHGTVIFNLGATPV